MARVKKETEANRVNLRGLGQLARRRPGGNWHVSFSVNGQQYRETTGTPKYNEAVAFLKRRVGDVQTGNVLTVTQKIF